MSKTVFETTEPSSLQHHAESILKKMTALVDLRRVGYGDLTSDEVEWLEKKVPQWNSELLRTTANRDDTLW